MKRRLSPQEKKILSYMSDGRKGYRGSDHGSRKSIPRFKKHSRRSARSATNQALRSLQPVIAEEVVNEPVRPWKTKQADRPLVTEVIAGQPLSDDGTFQESGLQKEANRRLQQKSPAEIHSGMPERHGGHSDMFHTPIQAAE